jgi:hypothetical protein
MRTRQLTNMRRQGRLSDWRAQAHIGRSAASVRFAKIGAASEAKSFNIEILGWVAGSFFAGYNNKHGASGFRAHLLSGRGS